jgi:VWFA-related protein
MSPRHSVLTFATLLACGAAVAARQSPAQAPVFRSGVDLIHLDVSVLDSNRRPIRGLTAADFTVLEDGRPQKIVAFSAIDVPAPPPRTEASTLRDIPDDVRSNDEIRTPEGRLFVILLDDALIPYDPAFIQNAKTIAQRVVDQISPADRVAVVFSAGSRGTQNFTNDRSRLMRAIDTLNPNYAMYTLGWETVGPPSPGRGGIPAIPVIDADVLYRAGSMRTLRSVAETLIAAPQRRKILLFVSPGITADPASASTPTLAGQRNGPTMALKEANASLVKEMPELFRRMQLANVTIYPVDPCGLGGLEQYVLRVASGISALRYATGPLPSDYDWVAPLQPPPPSDLARHLATLGTDFVLAAASNTGGRAIVNTNDFAPGIDRIFEENSQFYLIGYASATRHRPGSLHRLQVRVNRPDVEVRTRNGFATPEAESTAKNAPTATDRAMSPPTASGHLPMQVALAPFATADGPVVAIVLGLMQPAVERRTIEYFELQTAAFTPDGQRRGSQRQTGGVTLGPTPTGAPARYEFLSTFALPPGRYELRLAAERLSDRTTGSVYADVEVPDFEKDPLSLSGVFVEAIPAISAAPKTAFAGLSPIVPTANREFQTSDRVAVFGRIYQGAGEPLSPVTVTYRIASDSDARVDEESRVLAVDRFGADRGADLRRTLPVSTLVPGEYALIIEAARGSTRVSRSVRFTLR